MVRQFPNLVSPPWAPVCLLVLHLAPGLRDPMALCTPHELLHTPRVPKGSRFVHPSLQPCSDLGGFVPDDGSNPPETISAARSTKEVFDRLVDGDSRPIDVPP